MAKTFNNIGMGRIIAWISAHVFKKSEAVTAQVLGIDSTPSNNSSNLVTSGGVYDAINNLEDTVVWEAGTGTNSVIVKGSLGTAGGNYSTVEGKGSVTGGTHTEYDLTPDTADSSAGSYAHAEGRYTIACGKNGAHAEGDRTLASGSQSHAEGGITIASGNFSHAEGGQTVASGAGGHAEGRSTVASGSYSHTEGYSNIASATCAHAEGQGNSAETISTHAEGYYTRAIGQVSHAEGYNSVALGNTSHAEGHSVSYGQGSHAEGGNKGVDVFPVGAANVTTYTSAFDSAEWNPVRNQVGDTVFCNALKHSVIFPRGTANANIAAAIKVTDASLSGETITFTVEKTLSDTALDGSVNYWISFTVSYGEHSHVEGSGNVSYGEDSHAEGYYNFAVGNQSHVEGRNTVSKNVSEHAEGSFNISNKTSDTYGNAGNTQHSIGIGDSTTRKNAEEIMQNGDMYLIGVGSYNGTNYSSATTVQDVINGKQNALVSGTNIKTINNESILGSGNISISGGGGTVGTLVTNNTTAQTVSASESFSGTINLHKVAKTGTYSDLIGTPTVSSNVATDKADNTKVAGAKATYDEIHPAVVSSQPAGGFAPNVLYDLGTITGTVTFTMASPSDATIINHYYWTFETSSTAPTITWPAGITSWYGGSAPTIAASKHYEISVLDGVGCIMEV